MHRRIPFRARPAVGLAALVGLLLVGLVACGSPTIDRRVAFVDTDGKKPRTWEEQYKRKRSTLLAGQYDLHKTDANKNDKFDNDPIDKEGLWVIDAKGNITRH